MNDEMTKPRISILKLSSCFSHTINLRLKLILCGRPQRKMFYVKLISFISRIIGYSIIAISGLIYVQQMIYNSVSDVSSVALTAFATVAVLSALCFSFSPILSQEEDKNTALYAGEKFLHSTLLIVQTLFLKYVMKEIEGLVFAQSLNWLKTVLEILSNFFQLGIGGFAVTMAALGFHYLNKILWIHYEERAKQNLQKK